MKLTHLTEKGVRMVEISGKGDIKRKAKASGKIRLRKETIARINAGEVEKGNVLTTAQIAATLAVKKTPELIPLCHPLQITGVDVQFNVGEDEIETTVEVTCIAKTGVEMEAITGVATALLTIWDMVKSVEKDEAGQYPITEISEIRVLEKVKGE
ncbi:MAG: cyclic pyranopterin monophosphate synthase MoaC [Candidatus Hydrothermarchaeales archaeon]